MLEHPEIGWIERTGYPSWLQEQPYHKEKEWERQDPNRVGQITHSSYLKIERRSFIGRRF